MKATYDAGKDNKNKYKHGASLTDAEFIDWDSALTWQDTRRENARRIISLRKANQREFDYYEQEIN